MVVQPVIQALPIKKELPTVLKVITSPVTTGVLATGLAALINPALAAATATKVARFVAPKTVKGVVATAVGVPTAVGAFVGSKRARELAKTTLDPRESFRRGGEIGKIIEDPSRLLPKEKEGIKEKIKETFKKGGPIAGTAAAAAATGLVAKKAIEKVKEIRAKTPSVPVETIAQTPIVPAFDVIPGQISPVAPSPGAISPGGTFINQQIIVNSGEGLLSPTQ